MVKKIVSFFLRNYYFFQEINYLRKYDFSFGNMIFQYNNYLLRKYDFLVRANMIFQRKSFICFENITLLIKIMFFAKTKTDSGSKDPAN